MTNKRTGNDECNGNSKCKCNSNSKCNSNGKCTMGPPNDRQKGEVKTKAPLSKGSGALVLWC